ncbi:MAG: pilus assembly protein PilM, partial [Planctomycetes bacterium]|nr:pilus assembly protein PilM [Planctomycetota bacterium]
MAKVAWGIELGTTSVKAVKMTTTKEDVEILDIQIVELPKLDPELEQTYEERLQVALMDLSTQVKMKNDEVFISIPGHQTFNRSIAIPYLDPKKFRETVRFEAKNQFPGQIEESKILWDYQLITPNPTPGEDVEVLLFAARRDTVSQYIEMCNNAGIKVVGVQISSLAIYNFIRYDQKFGKSGIIVDIGGDSTDLLIIDDIKVWMRTLS